jgi:hypothetical protein
LFFYHPTTPFPGLAAIPPCLGAAFIILSGTQGIVGVGRLLALQPFVWVGLISYSLYLWHWPIMAFTRTVIGTTEMPHGLAAATILVSIVMACISTHFIEKPFRNKASWKRRGIFSGSLIGSAAVASIAFLVIAGAGLPARMSSSEGAALAAAIYEPQVLPNRCKNAFADHGADGCSLGLEGRPLTYMVWGDSHAGALSPTIDVLAKESGATGVLRWLVGCPPLEGVYLGGKSNFAECIRFNKGVVEALRARPEIKTVYLHARWPLYADGVRIENPSDPVFLGDEAGISADIRENIVKFEKGLKATVATLQGLGRKVVIIVSTPEIQWDVPTAFYARNRFGSSLGYTPSISDVAERNKQVDRVLSGISSDAGVRIVSPAPLLCGQTCIVEAEGFPVFRDSNHFSHLAAEHVIADLLRPANFIEP